MFSQLRNLVYTNTSKDVVEHDVDTDAEQWCYDGRDVYRGSIDPEYIPLNLNVHWLYDETNRVGLVEHDSVEPVLFNVLWFYDNPYATLFQDELWKPTGETLWSKLTNEAYQDCLEDDFTTVFKKAAESNVTLLTPELIMKMEREAIKNVLSLSSCILFLDDNFLIYHKTTPSQPHPPPDAASAQEQSLPAEQVGQ